MKQVSFVALTVFLLCSSALVHSQYVDLCDNNDINFNDVTNFDTTAMSCQNVWDKEFFTLRYAKAAPDLWNFLLSAYNPSSWIAIGFSTDGQMKGSSAMVGWMFPNATGKTIQYYLKDMDSDSVLPSQGNLTVVINSSTVFMESSRLYLAFQLSTPQPLANLIYAIGLYGVIPNDYNGLKLTPHRNRITTKVDFQTGKSQTQQSPFTGLRKTHGALNMIGWGILMPMGAIVARYFRDWDPMWFYAHITIQIFSFLFGIVGFMLGFVVEGFIKAQVTYHKNIGITILILCCFQVTALLVRPQKKLKIRKYWNWYHHNAGRVLVILAVSNIFYGIRLGLEGNSWNVTYGVIIGILFVTAVVLEFMLRRQRIYIYSSLYAPKKLQAKLILNFTIFQFNLLVFDLGIILVTILGFIMIELFLFKPIWGDDDETVELNEQRIALFDELETVIWGLVTSEGRSEARLWLCEAISSLTLISPREQRDLFMSLLRSKPRKWDLAEQVMQLIIAERPHVAGSILAQKSHRLEKFFKGHPRRMMQWFSTFSSGGDSAHGKGARALSQFAFINRDICWEELEWKGKHGQSPAVVATKPHYFLDLDVQRTVENFVENVPEFWSSKEFAESLKDGEIFSIDRKYFVDFFIDLMYEDDLEELWEVVGRFLTKESFSYLCQHLLIVLPEQDLCSILGRLQHFLSENKKLVNPDDKSYWLEILIRKCGNRVSIDVLLLLNALFNKGRQLLRLVGIEDSSNEQGKISDMVTKICRYSNEAKGLTPISKDHSKSKATETMKWLGLLSWSLLYRLTKECRTCESYKAIFVGNKIGFRNSDVYGLVEPNDASENSESEYVDRSASRRKHKRKQKSRKKRKRNFDSDLFHGEELLDLDDADDRPVFQSSSTSWLLSTDGYSSSWSLVDLPEHLSKHCLKEWMKRAFNDGINAA